MKRKAAARHERIAVVDIEKIVPFEQQLFGELSTEAPNVFYRNPQFHKQFQANSLFEASINAYTKLNYKLRELYMATSHRLHLQLIDLIALDFKKASADYDYKGSKDFSTADSKSKNIHISCITSMLSDADRKTVIDGMIVELEKGIEIGTSEVRIAEKEKAVSIDLIDASCLQCLSAHNFYRQVAESLRAKIDSQMKEGLRVCSTSNMKDNNALKTLIKDAPLMAIAELLSEREKKCTTIMIVLRHAERLNIHIFGELVEMMHRSSLKAHFVVFCSSKCALPLM
jgi:hypothetical protein